MVPEIWLSMRGCVCQSVDGHDDEAESEGRGQCDCLALAKAHQHGGLGCFPFLFVNIRLTHHHTLGDSGPWLSIFGTMKKRVFKQSNNFLILLRADFSWQ